MRITLMPMIVMIVSTFLHILFCVIFVNVLDTGVVGLAYASSLKDFFLMVSVRIYGSCSSDINVALTPITKEAFMGWCEYLRVALPSTVMICAEWWAFEILTILSGILGVTSLASMTVINSVGATLFMVPLGIQEATCGIIGNCIGANNVPLAKRFFSVITRFTMATILILSITTFFAREQIIAFYTEDAEVQAICVRVFALMACMFAFDGMQGYLQGPIRAMGLQQVASYCALGCYYLIGIPSACVLGFWVDLGVFGLQGGFFIAAVVLVMAYVCILKTKNWQDVADEATERITAEEARLEALRIKST